MGTRAAFWIGDPRQLDSREWLGCRAWDGYPGNDDFADLLDATSPEEFRKQAELLRDATPDKGWPYPWSDDIFLTDFTYAFIDGSVQVSLFHHGFIAADKAKRSGDDDPWPETDDPTCHKVPSGKTWDRSQPDSIILFGLPR